MIDKNSFVTLNFFTDAAIWLEKFARLSDGDREQINEKLHEEPGLASKLRSVQLEPNRTNLSKKNLLDLYYGTRPNQPDAEIEALLSNMKERSSKFRQSERRVTPDEVAEEFQGITNLTQPIPSEIRSDLEAIFDIWKNKHKDYESFYEHDYDTSGIVQSKLSNIGSLLNNVISVFDVANILRIEFKLSKEQVQRIINLLIDVIEAGKKAYEFLPHLEIYLDPAKKADASESNPLEIHSYFKRRYGLSDRVINYYILPYQKGVFELAGTIFFEDFASSRGNEVEGEMLESLRQIDRVRKSDILDPVAEIILNTTPTPSSKRKVPTPVLHSEPEFVSNVSAIDKDESQRYGQDLPTNIQVKKSDPQKTDQDNLDPSKVPTVVTQMDKYLKKT